MMLRHLALMIALLRASHNTTLQNATKAPHVLQSAGSLAYTSLEAPRTTHHQLT